MEVLSNPISKHWQTSPEHRLNILMLHKQESDAWHPGTQLTDMSTAPSVLLPPKQIPHSRYANPTSFSTLAFLY